jgi:dihydrofolate reductase
LIISMIVAIGPKGEIGHENKLLWHIPEDLKHFKKLTMGHHMVMGRKTFESIGKSLPGRTSIILTSREYQVQDEKCLIVHSIEQAMDLARKNGEQELFVIGGGEVYRQFFPLVDRLYLTRVVYDGPADTWFPVINDEDWIEKESIVHKDAQIPWSYHLLIKKKI